MSAPLRLPAVAGFFYEADPERLREEVERCSKWDGTRLRAQDWRALLLPHAGHVYSGRIAGAAIGRVAWPRRVILIGPNHRGTGAAASLSPAKAWRTPLGDVPADEAMTAQLLAACPDLVPDAEAHAREHALEVILPFLQVARPELAIVCISLAEPDYELCVRVGQAVAAVIERAEREGGEPIALVVSSDLNHYLARSANRAKDDRALEALLEGDAAELFDRVLVRERISMCGILPATALLVALKELGSAPGHIVARGDSADGGGEISRVVGYASVLWERTVGPAKEKS
ncbi:MAG: AmmeMemoRadiSam system protein B [Thermoanaerobaculia bacterium]